MYMRLTNAMTTVVTYLGGHSSSVLFAYTAFVVVEVWLEAWPAIETSSTQTKVQKQIFAMSTKLSFPEKFAMWHWDKGGTRNPLVKGEGIVICTTLCHCTLDVMTHLGYQSCAIGLTCGLVGGQRHSSPPNNIAVCALNSSRTSE